MPKSKNLRSKAPNDYWKVEEVLRGFDEKMKRAESSTTKKGLPKNEIGWDITKIQHQRSRYIYDIFYNKKTISRELYDWLLKHKFGDSELISKWKKQGYEKLCCLHCISNSHKKTCTCRIPKASSQRSKENPKTEKCFICGCQGCASCD